VLDERRPVRSFALAALLIASCAPSAAIGPEHPASEAAPAGRLVGPPAALRAGAAAEASRARDENGQPAGHDGHSTSSGEAPAAPSTHSPTHEDHATPTDRSVPPKAKPR
jgi:hypothetical protein